MMLGSLYFLVISFVFILCESQLVGPVIHYTDRRLSTPIGITTYNDSVTLYYLDTAQSDDGCTSVNYAGQIEMLTLQNDLTWRKSSLPYITAENIFLDHILDAAITSLDSIGILFVSGALNIASKTYEFTFNDPAPSQLKLISNSSLWSSQYSYIYAEPFYFAALQTDQRANQTTVSLVHFIENADTHMYIKEPSNTSLTFDGTTRDTATAVCNRDLKCILSIHWVKTVLSDPHIRDQPSGLYYKLYKLQNEVAVSNLKTLKKIPEIPENKWTWLKLDAGSLITQYQFQSNKNLLAGIGYGKSAADCSSILTSIRQIVIHDSYIEQIPLLKESERVFVTTEPDLPKPVPYDPSTLWRCSGITQKLSESGLDQYYLLRYSFKNTDDSSKVAHWTITLRHANNITQAIKIQVGDADSSLSKKGDGIWYSLDRSNVTSNSLETKVSGGLFYEHMPSIHNNVVILVDHGVIEVFFENGRYVITERFDPSKTLFDQICIEKNQDAPISITQQEVWHYKKSYNNELSLNDTLDDFPKFSDIFGTISGSFKNSITYLIWIIGLFVLY